MFYVIEVYYIGLKSSLINLNYLIAMKNRNYYSVLGFILLALLSGCQNATKNSENLSEEELNQKKKDFLLYQMSGIWVNKYNLTAELDLFREDPFWTDKYGNTNTIQIIGYDLDNLTIVTKEIRDTKEELGLTLRLIPLENNTYALAWKYDTGQLLYCSFVRKLNRFITK